MINAMSLHALLQASNIAQNQTTQLLASNAVVLMFIAHSTDANNQANHAVIHLSLFLVMMTTMVSTHARLDVA